MDDHESKELTANPTSAGELPGRTANEPHPESPPGEQPATVGPPPTPEPSAVGPPPTPEPSAVGPPPTPEPNAVEPPPTPEPSAAEDDEDVPSDPVDPRVARE